MLDFALAHVREHGHERVMVNAHYLWEQVASWADRHGVTLQVELPVVLGTGGGLRAAHGQLGESVVIVNADILSDVDLSALVASMPADGAAMALRASAEAESIGPVEADESGTVVRITSVVPSTLGVKGTHFTGVHAMAKSAVGRIPDAGEQCVIRTAYAELVPEQGVGSVVHDGAWVDVGTPQAYLEANLAVLAGEVSTPIDPWTRGDRSPDGSWVGTGARVDGRVQHSVLGDGCVVPSGADLTECVVWDSVTVPEGVHRRCVIYDDGKVLAID